MKNSSQQSAVSSQKKRSNKILFICLLLFTVHYSLFTVSSEAVPKGNLMDKVKQAVIKELMNSFSENVELTGLRIMKGMDIIGSEGDYAVKNVAMNGYNGKNKIIYLVALADRKAVHDVIVEASYDRIVDVFITSKPLAAGTILNMDDFYIVKQKASRLSVGAVLDKKDIEGKLLKANVGQGVILRSDYLTTQLSVKRGQKVGVVVEGNNVHIATQGVLKNDAVIGGVAKVFCDVSKKEVNGILVSPNTVKVKI